jgi:predicted transposase YdaD
MQHSSAMAEDDAQSQGPRAPETPHDALFRFTFSRPENAAGELRTVLPAALVAELDFGTLTTLPGSFIDEALAGRASDLLFSIELAGRPALIYVLFEHQSSDDPRMPLRLLGYMLRIWEQHERQHGKSEPLPPILPIVLHHAAHCWRSPVRFADLFAVDHGTRELLAPWLPDFGYVLDDLAAIDSADIHARNGLTAFARLVLFALQRARHAPDLARELEGFVDLIAELLRAERGLDDFEVLIRYTFWVADVPTERIRALLRDKVGPMVEERMLTTAEKLIASGEAKGRAEGEAKGRAAVLAKLLIHRFGPLPEEAKRQLERASADELDMWAERILSAASLAEVFEG